MKRRLTQIRGGSGSPAHLLPTIMLALGPRARQHSGVPRVRGLPLGVQVQLLHGKSGFSRKRAFKAENPFGSSELPARESPPHRHPETCALWGWTRLTTAHCTKCLVVKDELRHIKISKSFSSTHPFASAAPNQAVRRTPGMRVRERF